MVWSLARSSVEAAQRADDKTVEQWKKNGKVYALEDVKLCAPIPRPGKLICIGLNYRDHAAESNMPIPEMPITFSKFSTSIVGPDDPVSIPRGSEKTDYEAELAFVVGPAGQERHPRQGAWATSSDTAASTTSASGASSSPTGSGSGASPATPSRPWAPTWPPPTRSPTPTTWASELRLNGEILQNSRTEQLIFGIPQLIEFLSRSISLEPGDVIATGTPPGVGFARKPPIFLKPGDRMEVEIDGLGVLANPVAAAP